MTEAKTVENHPPANSYCMGRIDGRRCNASVPVTERYCASCKQHSKEMKKSPQR